MRVVKATKEMYEGLKKRIRVMKRVAMETTRVSNAVTHVNYYYLNRIILYYYC